MLDTRCTARLWNYIPICCVSLPTSRHLATPWLRKEPKSFHSNWPEFARPAVTTWDGGSQGQAELLRPGFDCYSASWRAPTLWATWRPIQWGHWQDVYTNIYLKVLVLDLQSQIWYHQILQCKRLDVKCTIAFNYINWCAFNCTIKCTDSKVSYFRPVWLMVVGQTPFISSEAHCESYW